MRQRGRLPRHIEREPTEEEQQAAREVISKHAGGPGRTSVNQLAQKLGCAQSTLSAYFSGSRPLYLMNPILASRIRVELGLSPEDAEAWLRGTGAEQALAQMGDGPRPLERRWARDEEADILDSLVIHLGSLEGDRARLLKGALVSMSASRPLLRYRDWRLFYWVRARVRHLRFNVNGALKLLLPLADRLAQHEQVNRNTEMDIMILMDAADALANDGRTDDLKFYRDKAEQRLGRFEAWARDNGVEAENVELAWGRLACLDQQIAYCAGDEDGFTRSADEAERRCTAIEDSCGLAKMSYFRGLWNFHGGEPDDARDHARSTMLHSTQIHPRNEWWTVRDGTFLSETWWGRHAASLWVDSVACLPLVKKSETYAAWAQYRNAQARSPWVRNIVPFKARYEWLADPEHQPDPGAGTAEARRWLKFATSHGCRVYATDIYLALGDALSYGGDERGAKDAYGDAMALAKNPPTLGHLLRAANRRLDGERVLHRE